MSTTPVYIHLPNFIMPHSLSPPRHWHNCGPPKALAKVVRSVGWTLCMHTDGFICAARSLMLSIYV